MLKMFVAQIERNSFDDRNPWYDLINEQIAEGVPLH